MEAYGRPRLYFAGGEVLLTFADSNGQYELGGPIQDGALVVDFVSPEFFQAEQDVRFDATIVNLPENPTGIWPQDEWLSGVWGLFLGFEIDLSDWTVPVPWVST